MYCEADLRPFAKYVTKDHPLKILNGQPLVLLTYIPGGSANENGDKIPMGSMASGSLYFDNFRVVYGDTVDDLENPVIDAVKAGAAELAEDGTTELKTNRLTLTAEFHDPAGENATGISPAKTANLRRRPATDAHGLHGGQRQRQRSAAERHAQRHRLRL